ncbi:MAG: hypothetical protein A3J93_02010 [Candidatus Magasanikbacteria bacterium RIFOXYC2_FULL_42_28]|uniref:Uncharacterized protein n=1 Tax=Candidatus Magasanikbacteria bacterium RIFOXYC2_FULL_42_28 TaxID=1798704 RepID=A0A1F6NWF1_9BACT|nr:MAG: hypothetical protein A3J93_02010 [Candidatus Magasanikbacteria bacterium RIFOXYC2_FULL_42_28]
MHPRLAAVTEFVVALLFWLALTRLTVFWMLVVWILFRLALSAMVIRLCYYPPAWKRVRHFLVLALFNFGLLFYLLFVEQILSTRLSGLIFIFLPALSFWLLPATPDRSLLAFKPERRVRLALTIFGLCGIWVGIYSSIILQIFNVHFWLWLFLGSCLSAWSAYFWWQEYEIENVTKMRVWALAVLAMMLELAWVIYLLPLGYFISGFLVTWFWYGLWIMARFYFTPAGINWKKQSVFLIVNGVLLFLFLMFVARWR